MARPRKLPADKRSETLAIRLSPAERLEVEQAAAAAGLSASEYARRQVLEGRVVTPKNRTLDHCVFDELRRIGVNLNQLTRLAHQRAQFPAGLEEVFAMLERVLIRELDGSGRAERDGSDGAPAPDHDTGYGPITVRFDPSIE